MENKYTCKYCGKICKNKNSLSYHIRAKHLGVKYKITNNKNSGFYQKVKCEKCGREITKACYQRHYIKCNRVISNIKNNDFEIINNKYICKICGKSFNKFGINSHIFRAHSEKRFKFNNKLKHCHQSSSLKGKTFEQIFGKERSLNIKSKISNSLKGKSHKQTEETKQKISLGMKKIKAGGLRKGSGRGKKGYYNGIYCDSTYELIFLIYCLDHNIKINRCKQYRKYFWNDKWRKYYPDFIINDQVIEIKGFSNEQFKYKILYNQDIKVLFKKDIQYCFDYVDEKYKDIIGIKKDYIKLYDKKED